MKRFLLALSASIFSSTAVAANPALGIHNISGYVNAITYTTPTGYTSQTSGSSFVVFFGTSTIPGSVTVLDTINGSGSGNTWVLTTLTGGNPINDSFDGNYLYAYTCSACNGGINHEVTITLSDHVVQGVDFVEIKNASAVDLGASAYNGNASSTVSVAVTPTVANDMLVAAAQVFSNTAVAPTGAGWTALDSNGGTVSLGSGYLTGAAASSQNALMGVSTTRALVGITIAFKGAGGASCTHTGITSAGAIATPNGSSGSYQGKSGAFVAPDCSSIQYKQPTQGAFGTSMLWQRPVSLEAMAR